MIRLANGDYEIKFLDGSVRVFDTLRGADLRGADLKGVDLRRASLFGADLRGADLRWANLRGADLFEADLRRADLREANLIWADLRGADLSSADLRWADLSRADLKGVKGIMAFQYERHVAVAYMNNTRIRIGCEDRGTGCWVDNFEDIGKDQGYNDLEIGAYGTFIATVRGMM